MHYSAEKKAELLKGWKSSGKSISRYVKEQGLVRRTFTKWIKADRDTQCRFVEVPAHVLRPAGQAAELLIEKGDIKVHLPLGMDSGEIQAVLEVLGAAI
jgi:transposase-like protein